MMCVIYFFTKKREREESVKNVFYIPFKIYCTHFILLNHPPECFFIFFKRSELKEDKKNISKGTYLKCMK